MVPVAVFTVLLPLAVVWKTVSSPFSAVLHAMQALSPADAMPTEDLSDRVIIVTGANTGLLLPCLSHDRKWA